MDGIYLHSTKKEGEFVIFTYLNFSTKIKHKAKIPISLTKNDYLKVLRKNKRISFDSALKYLLSILTDSRILPYPTTDDAKIIKKETLESVYSFVVQINDTSYKVEINKDIIDRVRKIGTSNNLSKFKIVLPIHYTFNKKAKRTVMIGLNWYKSANHFEQSKVRDHIQLLTLSQLGAKKFNYWGKKVRTKVLVAMKRKGSDGHNVSPVLNKFVFDALVHKKVLLDDNIDIIVGSAGEDYILDKDNPRYELTLEIDDQFF